MTIREQIRDLAVRRVVEEVKRQGPSSSFEGLVGECVEQVVDHGGPDARAYFGSANQIGLDRLRVEVANRARHKLESQGLSAEAEESPTQG